MKMIRILRVTGELMFLYRLAAADESDCQMPTRWIFGLGMAEIALFAAEILFLASGGSVPGPPAVPEFFRLLAFLPGVLMLGISSVSGDAVGDGDGFVLLALGFSGSAEAVGRLWYCSMLLAGGRAGMRVLRRSRLRISERAKQKEKTAHEEIPYLPCLFAAALLLLPGQLYG